MTRKTLNIARDFSKYPAGRYYEDGPYPGQKCREKMLVPALKESPPVTVELDGTRGYGSSFLEELFGGLVRSESLTRDWLKENLVIHSSDLALVAEVWTYIDDAAAAVTTPALRNG